MGTSKGYIAPTRPEWRKAKIAVSTYLKNRDPESRANAVSKYAEAMRTKSSAGKSAGSLFSSAVGNVLSFAKGIVNDGLDKTLSRFGRDDLIGKPPETIFHELLDCFTHNRSTTEDSLALAALSSAFEALKVETPDDLSNLDLDAFLMEVIIAFVNNDFDFHFHEKIGRGRTPKETLGILKDVHGYIDGMLRSKLTYVDISKIDLTKMDADIIVSTALDDAYSICRTIYGVDE